MGYLFEDERLELALIGGALLLLIVFVAGMFLWVSLPSIPALPGDVLPPKWTPSATPSISGTPTSLPRWADALTPTPTLTRTPTRTRTRLSLPARTPTPSPTATPSNRRVTVVAVPGLTPVYVLASEEYLPSRKHGCNWFGIAGTVKDSAGRDLTGIIVRVWADGWVGASARSGQFLEYGASGWEVYLNSRPKIGMWNAQVMDDQGNRQSAILTIPSTADCGQNLILLHWKRLF